MRSLLPAINIVLIISLMLAIIWAVYDVVRLSIQKRTKAKDKAAALPDDAGIRDLIADGRKDEAVRLYQQFTGVDMFTAKGEVEKVEQQMQDDAITTRLNQHLEAGDKAGAIEAYQDATGADLHDALTYVEQLQNKAR